MTKSFQWLPRERGHPGGTLRIPGSRIKSGMTLSGSCFQDVHLVRVNEMSLIWNNSITGWNDSNPWFPDQVRDDKRFSMSSSLKRDPGRKLRIPGSRIKSGMTLSGSCFQDVHLVRVNVLPPIWNNSITGWNDSNPWFPDQVRDDKKFSMASSLKRDPGRKLRIPGSRIKSGMTLGGSCFQDVHLVRVNVLPPIWNRLKPGKYIAV